jgi:hypothetical protein
MDPGAMIHNDTSHGQEDIFISKYDQHSNLLWSRSFGGSTYFDFPYSMIFDHFGNSITTGVFYGNIDFDPGPGIDTLHSGTNDAFILKLNPTGDLIWAKNLGGAGQNSEMGFSVGLDDSGNVYSCGSLTGSGSSDFDPGIGTYLLDPVSFAQHDIYLSKLDANGNFVWAHLLNGNSSTNGYGTNLIVDGEGNLYLTGFFSGIMDFDPGPDTTSLQGSNLQFLAKYDRNCNIIWVKTFVGGTANPDDMQFDKMKNIVIAGSFTDTIDFDPGTGVYNINSPNNQNDGFITKLDTAGNLIWAFGVGGLGHDKITGLSFDANNCIYMTGSFKDTVDFDHGPGVFNLISGGSQDAFIMKVDSAANFEWVSQITGSGTGNFNTGQGTVVIPNGDVYATGYFGGTVDFNPDSNVYSLSSNGDYDIYFMKLSQTILNVSMNDLNQIISVYPNPGYGQYTVLLKEHHKHITAKVYSLMGQMIFESEYFNSDKLDLLFNSTPGVYIVSLTSPDGLSVKFKLVNQSE